MTDSQAHQGERVTLALTGASGVQYAWRLLEVLVRGGHEVFFMASKAALLVSSIETGLCLPARQRQQEQFLLDHFRAQPGQIRVFDREQWTAPVASGSSAPNKMVICPASTGTLSAVATGASNNLIERAADVAIKERRTLIMVPRESPLSAIHLQHMLALTQMGVVILPASPGFYHKPASIDDLVDFVVARILAHLNIEQSLVPAWGEAGAK